MSQYKILDMIDISQLYDHDMPALYAKLSSLKKSYYEPNEKIVIQLYEMEFYYRDHPVGFTSHNLATLISRTDIDPSVFVIYTNQIEYQKVVDNLFAYSDSKPTVIFVQLASVSYPFMLNNPSIATGNNKSIKYPAFCLLGKPRVHKEMLFKFFTYEKLEDKIHTNFNTVPNIIAVSGVSTGEYPQDMQNFGLVYAQPYRMNETWMQGKVIEELKKYTEVEIPEAFLHPNLPAEKVTVYPIGEVPNEEYQFIKDYAFCVVPESQFAMPTPWFSEKTYRCFQFMLPFVVVGTARILETCQKLGYKTFSDYWDESYDQIQDHQERFLAVTQLIKTLANKSIEELTAMYNDMLPILQHNQNVVNEYIDKTHKELYNQYSVPYVR